MAVADGLRGQRRWCWSATRCTRRASPTGCASSTSPAITVPCLFVHGTRDPFGTPDELVAATATIAGPVTHVWIEGGRHDLKGADAAVASAVAAFLRGLR